MKKKKQSKQKINAQMYFIKIIQLMQKQQTNQTIFRQQLIDQLKSIPLDDSVFIHSNQESQKMISSVDLFQSISARFNQLYQSPTIQDDAQIQQEQKSFFRHIKHSIHKIRADNNKLQAENQLKQLFLDKNSDDLLQFGIRLVNLLTCLWFVSSTNLPPQPNQAKLIKQNILQILSELNKSLTISQRTVAIQNQIGKLESQYELYRDGIQSQKCPNMQKIQQLQNQSIKNLSINQRPKDKHKNYQGPNLANNFIEKQPQMSFPYTRTLEYSHQPIINHPYQFNLLAQGLISLQANFFQLNNQPQFMMSDTSDLNLLTLMHHTPFFYNQDVQNYPQSQNYPYCHYQYGQAYFNQPPNNNLHTSLWNVFHNQNTTPQSYPFPYLQPCYYFMYPYQNHTQNQGPNYC